MASWEQQARDMLERIGVEDAQNFSAGDLVELANLIGERGQQKTPAATRKYDSTVARIAGNILSGRRDLPSTVALREEAARDAVAMAREIVSETKRTEPEQDAKSPPR